MSVTVKQIFDLSLSLCEALDRSGSPVDSDCIKLWEAKSVLLCNTCQNELAAIKPAYENIEIDCSEEPELRDELKKQYTISDRLTSVLKYSANSKDLCLIEIIENKLYVSLSFTGNVSMLCKIAPLPVNSLQSAFSFDDNLVKSLVPYYLAADFLFDENPERSQLYLSLFQNGKLLVKNAQSSAEEIVDMYGGV